VIDEQQLAFKIEVIISEIRKLFPDGVNIMIHARYPIGDGLSKNIILSDADPKDHIKRIAAQLEE
jgi:hypothetical protein